MSSTNPISQTAVVNVRTAKIQLLQLLNDRTPVDQFDVTGPFDFTDLTRRWTKFRRIALDTRPDLRAAVQAVEKAKTDHQLAVANGSTDPTFSVWVTHNPSFNNPFDNNTIGASVSIPLRIFDRNQGEKERTEIDIRRNERLQDAATAQVYSDVDSAYATRRKHCRAAAALQSQVSRRGRQRARHHYLLLSARRRSLLDFLSAENDYRAFG